MWWAGAERWDAYLGTRRAAVCAGQRLLHTADVDDTAAALEVLVGWLRAPGTRPRLRVWLGAALCRPFLLERASSLRGAAELDLAALAMARRAMAADDVRLWLDLPVPAGGRCLGVAAAGATIAALERRLPPLCRGRCRVAPWWASALGHESAAGVAALPALAVRDGDALTLLAGSGAQFDFVRSVSPIDDEVCDSTLARWALAAGLDAAPIPRVRLARAPVAPGAGAWPMALGPLAEAWP